MGETDERLIERLEAAQRWLANFGGRTTGQYAVAVGDAILAIASRPANRALSPSDILEQAAKALEPFARDAENRPWLISGSVNDEGPIGGSSLRNGDLRRAREALAAVRDLADQVKP